MTLQKLALRSAAFALLLLLLLAAGTYALRALAPPEIAWRVAVLVAKLRGDLDSMPLVPLVGWLAPRSPVHLAGLAESPNPHAAIRNDFTSAEDQRLGRALYGKHCAQCHGDAGRGHTGPDLVSAVALKSDWSFLSTAKWGRAGTAMVAQPLNDREIWQVHAYLRNESLGAVRPSARTHARRAVHVEPQEIAGADRTTDEWLTYAGNYLGHRHSALDQIAPQNVKSLRVEWIAQLQQVDRELQVSPIVADGVMYVSQSREGVSALDARSGAVLWTFRRAVPERLSLCCGMPNRGVAVLGDTVFVVTIDAHLVALDANSGRQRWMTRVADHRDGYSMTGAPLALADRVIVGVAGGEFGVRGFVAAYDILDGRLLWKFETVPGPGAVGHDTWAGESWKTGGAPTWSTGSYDREQDLVIWGTGNPSPAYLAAARRGDNLFSNSVIALDAKSGRLRWHYQFTPNDDHDWDSTQQPILADIVWQGQRRAVVLWANRNAFFYALDRRTGEFLFARPFVKQTWNAGFDARGRPAIAPEARPTETGTLTWPALTAATNWWPPSYDPARRLVFVPASDAASVYFKSDKVTFERGRRFEGSTATKYSPNLPATAYVKAIDATSGEIRWETVLESTSDNFVWTVGGLLSTTSGLVFVGYRDEFLALDADTGKPLWRINLGGRVRGSPISFALDGRQFIAVAAGHTIAVFSLPER